MTTYSIQVTNYWGDYDSLHDVLVIGPYPTREARDADLDRLSRLPDVYGLAGLTPSRLSTEGAYKSATPEEVANAANLEDLVCALYHLPASREAS